MFVFEGLSNVEFHCGKAEDVFPNILNALVSPNLTAIVDPPRAGLREYNSQNMTVNPTHFRSSAVFSLH